MFITRYTNIMKGYMQAKRLLMTRVIHLSLASAGLLLSSSKFG